MNETIYLRDAIVTLDRPDTTTTPTVGGAGYAGQYYGRIDLTNNNISSVRGTITGDATINVSFGDAAMVSGEISNRVIYQNNDEDTPYLNIQPSDLSLTATDLTADGQVALDGIDAPRVTGGPFTVPGSSGGTTTITITSGRYGGMVSGPDAEHFIGGVEIIYSSGLEIGVITASQAQN